MLVEKPTEEDTISIAIIWTWLMFAWSTYELRVWRNVYKSFYDLGNVANKILSDNEKSQILDMGPLKPSGPFPTNINQINRCFSEFYYISYSKNGSVNRFWMCYSKLLDAAHCKPCWLFPSQRNIICCTGIRDWKRLSERIKQHNCSSRSIQKHVMCINFG